MTIDLSGVRWRKSRMSGNTGGCVEVAFLPSGEVAVRDTKHRELGSLIFTAHEWRCFLDGVYRHEFDLR